MRVRVLFWVTSLVAVSGMLWGSVTPASACSCVPTTESPYERADTVVVGTVVRMVRSGASPAPGVPVEDVDPVIAVEEYLKGAGPPEITADDAAQGGCGFFDESSVGRRYVVYLSGQDSPFKTGYCSGNYELAVGGGGDGGPTPTVISAAQPIEQPPDPPGWGATVAPPTDFGGGTPAPVPVRESSGDPSPITNLRDGTPTRPIAVSPVDLTEPSNADEAAAQLDREGGDPPTSADTPEQLDAESGGGLLPIVATAAPLVFLAGAAYLWRRRSTSRSS